MGDALKVGKEGTFWARFYFQETISPQEFQGRFSAQIPPELEIVKIE